MFHRKGCIIRTNLSDIFAAFLAEMSGADHVSNPTTVTAVEHLASGRQAANIHLLLALMPQRGSCYVYILEKQIEVIKFNFSLTACLYLRSYIAF